MTLLETSAPRPETAPRHRPGAGLAAGLVVLIGVLLVVCFFSITLGSRGVGV